MNNIINNTNNTLAIQADTPETALKPKKPAIIATSKNTKAHPNILNLHTYINKK
ncbi:MAG: hypothetical protein QT09_C0012G0032 [archaeon GW2011_AR18]|nr:MAG: hypothetical protein QT09_C0012G0032 [archaeon GW2011_AR18]